MAIKAIIIDDEERARNTLSSLLLEYCKDVEVVDMLSNVPDGVIAINKHKPDVVFLDIEMPEYNGFELLSFFTEINFDIVFVTAYSQYAIRAFEVSVFPHPLSPANEIVYSCGFAVIFSSILDTIIEAANSCGFNAIF